MKARKILVSLAALALVAAISIGGTLAYLTNSKSVTNTFTVGNVTIKLDETVTNPDGTATTDPATRAEKGNSYKLIPGGSYIKDPTVTVMPGSEESYVRLIVKVSDVTDAVKAFGEGYDLSNIFRGFSNKWSRYGQIQTSTDGKTLTYEYRYATTVTPTSGPKSDGVLEPLFTSVQIPGTLTDAQYAALNNLNIEIIAEAVQAAGFNGDVNAAWQGFANQK